MSKFQDLVQEELSKARSKHRNIYSIHESVAVILEEFEEFKAEVFKRDPNLSLIKEELVQVAAMCQRTAEDLKLV